MTISHSQPGGYGPLGTPNAGRAERVARHERQDALRYRAAAISRDQDCNDAEVRRLEQEVRCLRDMMPGLTQAAFERICTDQLPEAVQYLVCRVLAEHSGPATRRARG